MSEAEKQIPQEIAELSFEKSLEELEMIVAKLEQEQMPLETLLTVFERGNHLARHCREKLDSLEKRIEILSKDAQGNPQWQEF